LNIVFSIFESLKISTLILSYKLSVCNKKNRNRV